MERSSRRTAMLVLTLCCAGGFAATAAAADAADRYPSRPVRVVNPYAPGGITDVTIRAVLPQIAHAWGQQIVIDNRPGAGTNIGTEIVVRAQPDGYTMLATTGAIATNPSFYPNLSFKATRDLAPMVLIAETPGAFAVQTAMPTRTLAEFVALARQQPGKLTVASAGTGTSTHLAIELFKLLAKIDVVHVPFKGGGGGIVGVMGGQLNGIFTPLALVIGHHRAGKLRILAVTTPARSPLANDIPTFIEGGVAGYEATSWIGMFAPKATPAAIVQKWNGEMNRQIRAPEVQERFKAAGLVARGGSEREFNAYFLKDTERWATVIKTAGISVAQ
jgi:tripartite-type tricarboxylate transporter receptor subunit TctC